MTKKLPKRRERPGVDRLGRTALHYAANEGRLQDAAALLESGADPNARDDNGFTPLHFAAGAANHEVAKLLLAAGADVNAADSDGNSPLSNAVFSCKGEGSLIDTLRAAGADPYQENNHGVSPIKLARDIGNYDVEQFFSDLP
jgi:ankyrin repeat protein